MQERMRRNPQGTLKSQPDPAWGHSVQPRPVQELPQLFFYSNFMDKNEFKNIPRCCRNLWPKKWCNDWARKSQQFRDWAFSVRPSFVEGPSQGYAPKLMEDNLQCGKSDRPRSLADRPSIAGQRLCQLASLESSWKMKINLPKESFFKFQPCPEFGSYQFVFIVIPMRPPCLARNSES